MIESGRLTFDLKICFTRAGPAFSLFLLIFWGYLIEISCVSCQMFASLKSQFIPFLYGQSNWRVVNVYTLIVEILARLILAYIDVSRVRLRNNFVQHIITHNSTEYRVPEIIDFFRPLQNWSNPSKFKNIFQYKIFKKTLRSKALFVLFV